MKHLFFLALIFNTVTVCAQCPVGSSGSTMRTVDTAGSLRISTGAHRAFAYSYGRDSLRDGLGSPYMFDTASTAADDGYLHIQPGLYLGCPVTKGRWERVVQSPITYPQGVLYKLPGALKVFIGNVTTATSTNTITVNLTSDNTTTGPSLFSSTNIIAEASANPSSFPAGSSSKLSGAVISSGNKTATFNFDYTSIVTVALVANLLQLGTMPSGTPIKWIVQGF